MTDQINERAWANLWHRQAEGESLSSAETEALTRALQDEDNLALSQQWQALEAQLDSLIKDTPLLPADPTRAKDWAEAIALSAALEHVPAAPFSLAAGLSRQIAHEANMELEAADPLATWLASLPAPTLPESRAKAIASAIAQEAQQRPLTPTPPEQYHWAARRWAAGVSTLLAFGGLGALKYLGTAYTTPNPQVSQLSLLNTFQPSATLPKFLQWPLAALSTPASLLGFVLLILSSALIIWRPTKQGVALVFLAVAAALSLPALWHSLDSFNFAQPLSWGPLLVAGLLLQMALLFVSGQARTLVSQQFHFPVQALAAGTLSTLGLTGLLLLMLAAGMLWAAPLLGGLALLAVVVGLGVTLLSLSRHLSHLVPAAPQWVGVTTSLGLYSASLAVPPLAALLLLVGGAWGLGSVLVMDRNNSQTTEA